MSTLQCLFYAERFGNRVHCTFIFTFLVHFFLKVFFFICFSVQSNTNNFWLIDVTLTGTSTTPGQSGPVRNGNEGVCNKPSLQIHLNLLINRIDWLTSLNSMLTSVGWFFYASRLRNHIHINILLNTNVWNRSIWPIDDTLTGTSTTPGQSRTGYAIPMKRYATNLPCRYI